MSSHGKPYYIYRRNRIYYCRFKLSDGRLSPAKSTGDIRGTPWHKENAWPILPEPVKYPIGTVPIKGYHDHGLDEIKRELRSVLTASLYSINYELKHIADEGRLFNNPQFDNWPERTKRICAFLDPSYKGDNTTALSMIA
jgi:hypothetical protein